MNRLVGLGLVLGIVACTPINDPMHQAADTAAVDNRDCATAADGCTGTTTNPDAAAGQPSASKPKPDAGDTRSVMGAGSAGSGKDPSEKPAAADSGKTQDAGTPLGVREGQSSAGAAAADASTTQPNAASGDTLVRPDDSECDYVEVRARGDAAGTPFQVPQGDFLQCFLMDAGFDGPTQAFSFSPLLDNAGIVTDIVLRTLEYSDNRGPVVTCADSYPTHQMVAVWAQGADDWYYPKDMGIDLGRGLFLLEVHYDNKGSATTDASGMRICKGKSVRPRTASMSWLGDRTFSIPAAAKDYAAKGHCTPANQKEPIHILRVMPFANHYAKRVSMQIDHIDGTTQPMFDEPFDYTNRKIYDTPAVVRVGDSVASACVFDNPSPMPVGLGVTNDTELCHMFVLAYPALALVDNAFSVENNSCTGGDLGAP